MRSALSAYGYERRHELTRMRRLCIFVLAEQFLNLLFNHFDGTAGQSLSETTLSHMAQRGSDPVRPNVFIDVQSRRVDGALAINTIANDKHLNTSAGPDQYEANL